MGQLEQVVKQRRVMCHSLFHTSVACCVGPAECPPPPPGAGYLLEKLSHDPGWLGGCLHIVLDEAHERSADMDLLAMLLRALKAGAAHRSGRPHLTVMSATLQAAVFARYFAAPPLAGTTGIGARVLEVPRGGGDEEAALVVGGRRFPVAELCLDSLAAPTEESRDMLSAMGLLDAVRHPKVGAAPASSLAGDAASVGVRVSRALGYPGHQAAALSSTSRQI